MFGFPAWASVIFVGVEDGAAPSFRAQRWSLAEEKKTFAVSNNAYGSSGYYVLAPGKDVPSTPVTHDDITGFNTALLKPDFLAAHPTPVAGTWVNYPGYALVTKPQPTNAFDAWRIGGISAPLTGAANGAGEETKFADFFSFKLSADAHFRLGILVDAFDSGGFAPDYVSVYDDASKKAVYNAAALKREAVPKLVLFDIDGKAGSTYAVALHRKTTGLTGFSLITFDKLPETAAAKSP
jgi:hypothetical protein